MSKKYFPQIDILKGLLIISVLIMHAFPLDLLQKAFYLLHVGQAIPIFIIILGFNQAISFSKDEKFIINVIYYHQYLKKKIVRIIIPFILAFVISLFLGFLFYLIKNNTILRLNRYLIFGRLPLPGPGNYFISLLLQYTLTLPILYRLFIKHPITLLISSSILSIIVEIYGYLLSSPIRDYALNYFKFLPALFLGIWLSTNWKLNSKRCYYIYLSVILAFIYQIYLILVYEQPVSSFYQNWRGFNYLSFFYPAFIFIISLHFLPSIVNNKLYKLLSKPGKASYHIFLTQVIYFSFVRSNGSFNSILINIVFCILLGKLFYVLDNKYFNHLLKK